MSCFRQQLLSIIIGAIEYVMHWMDVMVDSSGFRASSWFGVDKWVQCFHDDGHVWSEVCFVLHAQCRYCRQLKHTNICLQINSEWITHMLLLRAYLGNGLWWIIIVQFGVHTLLHFILTQSWSGLQWYRDELYEHGHGHGHAALNYPGDQTLLAFGHRVVYWLSPCQKF